MDAGDFVDDVAQQIAALHAVIDALEHSGDNVAAVVAIGAGQRAQVSEQPRALPPIRAHGFIVIDKGEQLIAGDALRVCRPIPPAIRAASIAGLNFLLASAASSSRCNSRSSRNFRNIIHVSNGKRSRSPFSPLSLRMMSRADLRRLPSICDVVIGAARLRRSCLIYYAA